MCESLYKSMAALRQYRWEETTAGDSLTLDLNAATDRTLGVTIATFTDSAKDAVETSSSGLSGTARFIPKRFS